MLNFTESQLPLSDKVLCHNNALLVQFIYYIIETLLLRIAKRRCCRIKDTLRTSLNVYSTYENVSDKVGDYRKMLNDFRKKCLERGNIMSTDTLIITINTKALAKIADEGDNLYRSVSDLLLYATGAAACSTSDLLLIITSINNSLDNINKHLNKAYFETWRYIQVRIGYWKKQVYRAKSKEEIISDAFGRWRGAGYLGY